MITAELGALSLVKQVDLENLKPVIRKADQKTQIYWDYWRCVLSSTVQGGVINMGRTNCYFMFDDNSGGLLGVFALTDTPVSNPFFSEYFGWDVRDIPDEELAAKGSIANKAKRRSIHTIVSIRRCLPLYEFGGMLGGKLLTLGAASNEVIRSLEVQYSFKLSLLYTRALHGKASQYNRLEANGLRYMGLGKSGEGYYFMELRQKAERYLRGDVDRMGKLKVKSFPENVEFWKERWLQPRIESTGTKVLDFDRGQYEFSTKIKNRNLSYGTESD